MPSPLRAFQTLLFLAALFSAGTLCAQASDESSRVSAGLKIQPDLPFFSADKKLVCDLNYSCSKEFSDTVSLSFYKYDSKGDSLLICQRLSQPVDFKPGAHVQAISFVAKDSRSSFVHSTFEAILKKTGNLPAGQYRAFLHLQSSGKASPFARSYSYEVDSALSATSPLRKSLTDAMVPGTTSGISSLTTAAKAIERNTRKIERLYNSKGLTPQITQKGGKEIVSLYYQDWFVGRYELEGSKSITGQIAAQKAQLSSNLSTAANSELTGYRSLISQVRDLNKQKKEDKELTGQVGVSGNWASGQPEYSAQDNNFDQLNRIREAQNKRDSAGGLVATKAWYSNYTYDQDGNLKTLNRNADKLTGSGVDRMFLMDSLKYEYEPGGNNNRLKSLLDYAWFQRADVQDLTQYTQPGQTRFLYDAIGNTIKDLTGNVDSIRWNLYGKVSQVEKRADTLTLNYGYDGTGNRVISRSTKPDGNTGGYAEHSDYYMRDATGNILAIYGSDKRYATSLLNLLVPERIDMTTAFGSRKAYLDNVLVPLYGANPELAEAAINMANGQPLTATPGMMLRSDLGLFQKFLSNSARWAPALPAYSIGSGQAVAGDALARFITSHDGDERRVSADNLGALTRAVFFHPVADSNRVAAAELMAAAPALSTDFMRRTGSLQPSGSDPVRQQDLLARAIQNNTELFLSLSDSTVRGGDTVQLSGWCRLIGLTGGYMGGDSYYLRNLQPLLQGAIFNDAVDGESGVDSAAFFSFANSWGGSAALLADITGGSELRSIDYYSDPANYLDALADSRGSAVLDTLTALARPDLAHMYAQAKLSLTNLGIATQLPPQSTTTIKYLSFGLAEHHLYGSARLGINSYWPGQYSNIWDYEHNFIDTARLREAKPWYSGVLNSLATATATGPYGYGAAFSGLSMMQHVVGQKQYELTNHLGNVQSTVSDKRVSKDLNGNGVIDHYYPSLVSAFDYYPYGMPMPARYVMDTSTQSATITAASIVPVAYSYSVPFPVSGAGWMFTGCVGNQPAQSATNGGLIFHPNAASCCATITLSVTAGQSATVYVDVSGNTSPVVSVSEGGTTLASQWVGITGSYVYGLTFTPTTNSVQLSICGTPRGGRSTDAVTINKVSYTKYNYTNSMGLVRLLSKGNERYRFGFNGQMKVNEVAGVGNWNTALFWEYGTREVQRKNPDPVTNPSMSPFAVFDGNPIWKSDVLGNTASTDVKDNKDGTYKVDPNQPAKNLNDGDKGIYVVDDNGKRTGEKIGNSLLARSFYNEDEGKWRGTIDTKSEEGIRWMQENISTKSSPTVSGYIENWQKFNFKHVNYTPEKGNVDEYHYRGMIWNKGIYASARDFGNYGAGYTSGNAGNSWGQTKWAFERKQGVDVKGHWWGAFFPNMHEHQQTVQAEHLGWLYGRAQYIIDYNKANYKPKPAGEHR